MEAQTCGRKGAGEQEEIFGKWYVKYMVIVMMTVVAILFAWLGYRLGGSSAKATAEKTTQTNQEQKMSVAVQGPVTYLSWRSTPRFQQLGDRAWGAWPGD